MVAEPLLSSLDEESDEYFKAIPQDEEKYDANV